MSIWNRPRLVKVTTRRTRPLTGCKRIANFIQLWVWDMDTQGALNFPWPWHVRVGSITRHLKKLKTAKGGISNK